MKTAYGVIKPDYVRTTANMQQLEYAQYVAQMRLDIQARVIVKMNFGFVQNV